MVKVKRGRLPEGGGAGGQSDVSEKNLLRQPSNTGSAATFAQPGATASHGSAQQNCIVVHDNAVIGWVMGSNLGGRELGGWGLVAVNYLTVGLPAS
jgi:hypothetical protein